MELGYLPSIENVHEGDREHIWLLGAGEVGDVGVERNLLPGINEQITSYGSSGLWYFLGGGSLGNSQRDTKDGIGA